VSSSSLYLLAIYVQYQLALSTIRQPLSCILFPYTTLFGSPVPKSLQVPKPPILEDPEPPEEPAEAEAGKIDDEDKEEAESDGFDWGQALLIGVAVVVPLALLALPVVLVLAYKSRRRARRRTAPRPVDRVSGGWREVLDAAADLGTPVPAGSTRREGAGMLA